ncbi:MAG: hypothetical protein LBL33_03020 [Tannerella sp.]|jgi:hypothetical protein|nr:hypothetical protein [Tannerella sp.]
MSKKISYMRLKKMMPPKEMKNILGGSGICDGYGSGLCWVVCNNGNKACSSTCDMGVSWCESYGGLNSCDC